MEQANKWSISIYHKNIDLRNANDVRLHISTENATWERKRVWRENETGERKSVWKGSRIERMVLRPFHRNSYFSL